MKEIQKEYEEITYKPIKKTKTHKVWVASDGREFSGVTAKKDCEQWESVIEYNNKFNSIKKVTYEHDYLEGIPDVWFFPVTEEELSIVEKHVGLYDRSVYVHINNLSKNDKSFRKLKINEWIGSYYRDNGDHKADLYIYTLDYIMVKIEKFMGIFP